MMNSLCSSISLQMALTATVYFVVTLTPCSTKECRLQLTEKIKGRSVILRNIDTMMCQLDCVEDDFILASCSQSRVPRKTVMPSGNTPENVLKSCGSKVCKTTQVCVEAGCGMSCKQAPSFCDLHSASLTGNLEKVNDIVSRSHGLAGMNCKNWYGRTAVLLAARGGHKDVVQLLERNGDDVSRADNWNINILHFACLGGDVALVKYVLSIVKYDEDIDINEKSFCGGTPIMMAAEQGHRDVVELLVRRKANVLLRDKNGHNILHYASRGGNAEVVKYILSQNMVDINSRGGWSNFTPLMFAAFGGHRDVVELLFLKGANMSLKGKYKNNILHFACQQGHVEVVKYILSKNMVNINSKNGKHMTPVMLAAKRGHRDVEELLVNIGADRS